MLIASEQDLETYCRQLAQRAKRASSALARVTGQQKNDWLGHAAQAIRSQVDRILEANQRDVQAAPGFGLTNAQIDRLLLTAERAESIALGIEQIALLPDPVGESCR